MNKRAKTIFIDVLMNILLILIVILTVQKEDASAKDIVAPGSITITAEWPSGLDVDVDLWMQAPGDVPVGYSNKGGLIFNLLRDDLGSSSDLTPINLEFGFSRGIRDGEYTVNVHLYRTHGSSYPVPVHVVVSMSLGKKYVVLFDRRVVLKFQGQEITVQRWTLRDQGVVGKSLIPKALRSASERVGPGG